MTMSSPEPTPPEHRRFEDLTLAEALGELLHTPRLTWQALQEVMTASRRSGGPAVETPADWSQRSRRTLPQRVRPAASVDQRAAFQLALRLVALVVAWWGTGILANTPQRTEATALALGAPFMIAAVLLWLGAELVVEWPRLRKRVTDQPEVADAPVTQLEPETAVEEASFGRLTIAPLQLVLLGLGLISSLLAWRLNMDNEFSFLGFWAWVLSIASWTVLFSPQHAGPLDWGRSLLEKIRSLRWRSWTLLALLAIMLLAAAFRLADIEHVPPEMTSDHVELILDSFHVLNGQHNIFFANNGGRESFQMYAMALFSRFPGLGMNHLTLKLLTVFEGMVAILLMYWMGREIIGPEKRRLGIWVGLMLAALVAASYWHTVLSRLGLRIVVTTAVTPLLLIYLARAMRFNRREDYIKAGLVLGFGLYTYQAVRMLPVVITLGIGLAFLFNARSLRERGRYVLNYVALVLMALVVFVPLLGYALQSPDDFWRRTSGRLLGDDVITETDAEGNIVSRDATLQDRVEAFLNNLPSISNNMRNALLMFQWKGDVAWINGAPNEPALDTVSGALMILGLAAWGIRMARRRDMVDWLVPAALVIMLLPSALSIAYPLENPSHTRTSGALPEVYLIAALPLALIVQSVTAVAASRRGQVVAIGLVAVVVMGSYALNSKVYFEDHVAAYIDSSLPYTEAGRVLRGFAESTGSYGNAFMVGYPYWWDHRALGIDAGHPDWPGGVVSIDRLRDDLRKAYEHVGLYRYVPERDLLFFYSIDDIVTEEQLQAWFPQGRVMQRQSYQWDDMYKLYLVPALGDDAFRVWLLDESDSEENRG